MNRNLLPISSTAWIADRHRILTMRDDRATRAILTLVCLVAIVPWIIGVIFQVTIHELRAAWNGCRAGLKWLKP